MNAKTIGNWMGRAGLALACIWGSVEQGASAGEINADYFTTYLLGPNYQSVWVQTCSNQGEFCADPQMLTSFGKIGAMVEGYPTVQGSIVSRRIYILDVAAGTNNTEVLLMVYDRRDVVTDSGPQTTVTFEKAVPLPLVGGLDATGFIAGNHYIVAVGTDQNGSVVSVRKNSWEVLTDLDWGDGAVSSITANDNGYIVAKGGDQFWKHNPWFLFAPSGKYIGSGQGTVLLDSTTGLSTKGLYTLPQ